LRFAPANVARTAWGRLEDIALLLAIALVLPAAILLAGAPVALGLRALAALLGRL
jgi:hypothetical protein